MPDQDREPGVSETYQTALPKPGFRRYVVTKPVDRLHGFHLVEENRGIAFTI